MRADPELARGAADQSSAVIGIVAVVISVHTDAVPMTKALRADTGSVTIRTSEVAENSQPAACRTRVSGSLSGRANASSLGSREVEVGASQMVKVENRAGRGGAK